MKESIDKQITVTVPASTANLGPGFDTLGLALSLYCRIKFTLLKKNDAKVPLISFGNQNSTALASDESNLAFKILHELWSGEPESLERVRLEITTDIPLGRGLGSSSTAILAAACAAHALNGRPVDKNILLHESIRYEGHADNLSPSLFGGLTVSSNHTRSRRVAFKQLQWPKQWQTKVIVPPYTLSTTTARSVLPKTVRLANAIANVQNTALLVAAIAAKDEKLAREALNDTLHEPYRITLVPELDSLRKHFKNAPIIGCVLSGAGSSVLLMHHDRHAHEVSGLLKDWQSSQNKPPEILDLKVDYDGLKCEQEH